MDKYLRFLMENDAPLPCGVCGLLLKDERHDSPGDCIRGLRRALLKQRQLAESLSFDVSTRYLAVLEELALRPDVGVPYQMHVGGSEAATQVSHEQVAGVFAAILRKYQEMGNWSPLRELEAANRRWRELADLFTGLIGEIFTEKYAVSCDRSVLDRLRVVGELATQLGVPPPALPGSGSRPH